MKSLRMARAATRCSARQGISQRASLERARPWLAASRGARAARKTGPAPEACAKPPCRQHHFQDLEKYVWLGLGCSADDLRSTGTYLACQPPVTLSTTTNQFKQPIDDADAKYYCPDAHGAASVPNYGSGCQLSGHESATPSKHVDDAAVIARDAATGCRCREGSVCPSACPPRKQQANLLPA